MKNSKNVNSRSMVKFTITNVKVSLKTSPIVLDNVSVEKSVFIKRYKNFIVIKQKYTYIIFKTNKQTRENHINITKIPSIYEVSNAVEHLKSIIDFVVKNSFVDNIIAIANVDKQLNLINICNSGIFKQLKYNNEKFPGLFIKFDTGTVILFHSGKVVIVGCKTINDIECLITKIYANI